MFNVRTNVSTMYRTRLEWETAGLDFAELWSFHSVLSMFISPKVPRLLIRGKPLHFVKRYYQALSVSLRGPPHHRPKMDFFEYEQNPTVNKIRRVIGGPTRWIVVT